MSRLLAIAALAALMTPGAAWAQTPTLSLDQMDIAARTTEYDGRTHVYQVKGDVTVAMRGLRVTCQEAFIYTTPKEDQVDHIVFNGQVVAHRGVGTFRGERVTYWVAQRRLLAEGGTHTRLLVPASGSAPVGVK